MAGVLFYSNALFGSVVPTVNTFGSSGLGCSKYCFKYNLRLGLSNLYCEKEPRSGRINQEGFLDNQLFNESNCGSDIS